MLPLPAQARGVAAPPSLLDEVTTALRSKRYSGRTIEAYTRWMQRYLRFHGLRHPRELDAGHIRRFLRHLAEDRHASVSTQRQAFAALRCVYRQVLGIPLPADLRSPG